MKKVLILCTGNSCRSIIAEALINRDMSESEIKAYSAGSSPVGRVNPYAVRVLKEHEAWSDTYHSKGISDITRYAPYDLVVSVCDGAASQCPAFPGALKYIHIGFEDPDGKDYQTFVKTLQSIEKELLPAVEHELSI